MLNVFFTVDVEIWPDNWDMAPANFNRYFDRYIYGRTSKGDYGLPYQLKIAQEYDLKFVLFVEGLFTYHYGIEPLKEIVNIIASYDQEIQLHLHAEWVGKMARPILPGRSCILLREYSMEEQAFLIRKGIERFNECEVLDICAFRAGSFSANKDTLEALYRNGISIDSSYNPAGQIRPMLQKAPLHPFEINGVKEYPLSVYEDYPGHLRQIQLTACSFLEMKHILQKAYDQGWQNIVILSHSVELLNGARERSDPIIIRRFNKLCEFLASNKDKFNTRWFHEVVNTGLVKTTDSYNPLISSPFLTGLRMGEQVLRRLI